MNSALRLAKIFKKMYPILMVICYLFIALLIFANYKSPEVLRLMRPLGGKFGQLSVVSFALTLLPGIARRLATKHNIFSALLFARPELGKTAFLFALLHFVLERGLYFLNYGIKIGNTMEIMGTLSLLFMMPLYFTSSPKWKAKLGHSWKTLHALIYLIVWLIFGHIALQGASIVFFLIAPLALVELISLYYFYLVKPKSQGL